MIHKTPFQAALQRRWKGSLADLARQAGVPYRTLNNWVLGLAVPRDAENARKVADVLCVKTSTLIGWATR